MEVILIITTVILFIGCMLIPPIFLTEIDTLEWYHIVLIIIIEFVLITSISAVTDEAAKINEPKAIDVYRGKTTLKINYIDSIPQDTVVVFKRKDK